MRRDSGGGGYEVARVRGGREGGGGGGGVWRSGAVVGLRWLEWMGRMDWKGGSDEGVGALT